MHEENAGSKETLISATKPSAMKGLSIFLIALTLFSCRKESLRGSGDTVSETRTIAPFTAVETHYDIKAVISYGPTQQVEVTGYQNLLNVLETPVENGVLKLRFNKNYNTVRNVNVVAIIQLPAISGVAIHGSNDIDVTNFSDGGTFTAQVHGSGNIGVNHSAFQTAHLRINGSGSIEARGLQAKEATASINGSGNVFVTVSEKLTANINGSGNIGYWGNPTVDANVQGSGKLIRQ